MKSLSLKNIISLPEESKDIAELLAQKRGIEDYENMSMMNYMMLLGHQKMKII